MIYGLSVPALRFIFSGRAVNLGSGFAPHSHIAACFTFVPLFGFSLHIFIISVISPNTWAICPMMRRVILWIVFSNPLFYTQIERFSQSGMLIAPFAEEQQDILVGYELRFLRKSRSFASGQPGHHFEVD